MTDDERKRQDELSLLYKYLPQFATTLSKAEIEKYFLADFLDALGAIEEPEDKREQTAEIDPRTDLRLSFRQNRWFW